MIRSARLAILLAASALVGCDAEGVVDDRHLSIDGTVTYRGAAVKQGAIHFLPESPGNLPATGSIADGAIKDVFTRSPGDGIGAGRYKVAITSFDDAFLESVARRDVNGPDPVEVGRAAERIKDLIPARYSNPRQSGLVAEVSPIHRTLRIELVD